MLPRARPRASSTSGQSQVWLASGRDLPSTPSAEPGSTMDTSGAEGWPAPSAGGVVRAGTLAPVVGHEQRPVLDLGARGHRAETLEEDGVGQVGHRPRTRARRPGPRARARRSPPCDGHPRRCLRRRGWSLGDPGGASRTPRAPRRPSALLGGAVGVRGDAAPGGGPGTRRAPRPGARPSRCPGRYALRGLVDGHCHLTLARGDGFPFVDVEGTEARLEGLAADGVTLVRDVGGDRVDHPPAGAGATTGSAPGPGGRAVPGAGAPLLRGPVRAGRGRRPGRGGPGGGARRRHLGQARGRLPRAARHDRHGTGLGELRRSRWWRPRSRRRTPSVPASPPTPRPPRSPGSSGPASTRSSTATR